MNIIRPPSPEPIPQHAQRVFEGVIFDIFHWEQKMYDGTMATFESLTRTDGVMVLPVLDDGRILLCEQEQPNRKSYITGFGGGINEGENVLDAAKRELREESGYEASEFNLWRTGYVTTKIDWVVYTFIAKGLRKVGEMELDGGEKITLRPVTFDELTQIVVDERFMDKQILPEFYQALLYPEKMIELRKLFKP